MAHQQQQQQQQNYKKLQKLQKLKRKEKGRKIAVYFIFSDIGCVFAIKVEEEEEQ